MKSDQTLCLVRCLKNQIATHSCLNQKCQKYAFVCQSEQCQCHREHQDCLMIKIVTIIKSIKAKLISTKDLENCIESGIEKLIDQLSDFKDQILIKIQNEFQFLGVSESEKLILSQLKEGKTHGITGSQIWQAHLNFKKQDSIFKEQQKTIQKIKKTLQNFKTSIEKHCKQVDQMNKDLQNFSISQLKQNERKVFQKKKFELYQAAFQHPNSKLINQFTNSKIISSNQERIEISFFCLPKIIKSCKILYRASQNAFDISKFHKNCDNAPNTLIICMTEFGKKIGGYTPIPWKIGSGNYVRDESGQSFLFSLSNKDKLILQDKDKAVGHYNNNDYGPYFGSGCDFCISQKSNQNNNSYSRINQSYFSIEYNKDDKESFQRFNGNPQGLNKFKVKEWEVWQLTFEP